MSGTRFIVPEDTARRQRQASDPAASAWVGANAGSGKTHVLTNRVIRLMLAGSAPSKLLCLTFTKAAAATMSNRVFAKLADWAVKPDEGLAKDLADLFGRKPEAGEIRRARRLFAEAIETPGGLKIQTIHAFCEAILQRFPLEAELAGGFETLDDRGAAELFQLSRDRTLAEAGADPARPLGAALVTALSTLGEFGVTEALSAFIGQRDWFRSLLRGHGDLEGVLKATAAALGIAPGDDAVSIPGDILASPFLQAIDLAALVAMLAASGANDQKQAARFQAALEGSEAARAEAWLAAFFTDAGGPRAGQGVTKAIHAALPGLAAAAMAEIDRLQALTDRRRAIAAFATSAAILRLGDAVLQRYEAGKLARNMLDFSDLITRTADLLSRSDAAQWVQFKLDKGIDHVLVDEAQDTSPVQWAIVGQLVEEFFSGKTARPGTRTLFAVGDEKQSIYSFQGARPQEFAEKQRQFAASAARAGLPFHDIRLVHSFRSTPDVLAAVDQVFASEDARQGVSADWQNHLAVRADAPGRVEIWPLEAAGDEAPPEDWSAPLDRVSSSSPVQRVAEKVAAEIAALLDPGFRLEGTGAAVRPKDILILVRRRGTFVEAINRRLKERGIPAAGADRLKLFRHIAVLDLMALGQVMLLPEDDLSLAAVLKSPLIGISEDDLTDVAAHRDRGETLHAALARATKPALAAAHARLELWRGRAAHLRAFEFYAAVLGADGGRRAFRARLGSEADDVLDEFLAALIAHERVEGSGLVSFLAQAAGADLEIKREIDEARDEVRVMTVHGAKGLEAPVVFLVDGAGPPLSSRQEPKFLELPGAATPLMLMTPRKDDRPRIAETALDQAKARALEEHRRLLYVALTRAADRLVIAGHIGKQQPHEASWYERVRLALEPAAETVLAVDGSVDRRIWRQAARPPKPPAEADAEASRPAITVPDWLRTPVAAVTAPPVINPSRVGAPDEARLGPSDLAAVINPNDPALLRGRAIHRLMEVLPDLPPERRERAGLMLATRACLGDSGLARALTDEVLLLMADPDFAPCFGPGSRAEVPVIGRLIMQGRPDSAVSGRVDRLVVTETAILVLDFKTDRAPPPRVPETYVAQLAIYAALIGQVFPGRTVKTGVIWTALPRLDVIDPGASARSLKRLGIA